MENNIWVEKYRPKVLDDYIGNEHIKSTVSEWIAKNDPPHSLFYGSPGTGKTTLAKIIAKNTNSDYIYINASDERSIDVVRTKIKGFARSISIDKQIKIIILDEFDFMTPDAQAALRNVMEAFWKSTRFVLTANYHEKILDAIVSRCKQGLFHVIPPSKKEMAIRLAEILQKEEVTFNPEDIALLVNKSYPDNRALIGLAQQHVTGNQLKLDNAEIIGSEFKLQLLELFKTGTDKKNLFKDVRKFIADNNVTNFTDIFRLFFDELDNLLPNNIANAILILSEGQYQDAFVVDKEINFMAMLVKLIDLKFS